MIDSTPPRHACAPPVVVVLPPSSRHRRTQQDGLPLALVPAERDLPPPPPPCPSTTTPAAPPQARARRRRMYYVYRSNSCWCVGFVSSSSSSCPAGWPGWWCVAFVSCPQSQRRLTVCCFALPVALPPLRSYTITQCMRNDADAALAVAGPRDQQRPDDALTLLDRPSHLGRSSALHYYS